MVIWSSGGETGDLTEWTASNGPPTVENTVKHHGSWAIYCDSYGDRVYKDLADINEAWCQCAVRFHSLPPNNGDYFTFMRLSRSDGAGNCKARALKSAGTVYFDLYWFDNGFTWHSELTPITPVVDTWYKVKLWWKLTTLNGSKIWVDDVLRATASATTLNTQSGRVRVGGEDDNDEYIDCVAFDSADITSDPYAGPGGPTIKKGSCVPAMTALLTKFSALKQPREPKFQHRTFPKFTPRRLI